MILLFSLIAITSIWTLGIKVSTSEGMIFEKVGWYGLKKVNEGHKIFQALLVCHFCMPSIHAVVAYGFACAIGVINHFEARLVFMYPLVVMGASIFNGVLWGWHQKNESASDYYEIKSDQIYDEMEFYEDGVPSEPNNIYSHN